MSLPRFFLENQVLSAEDQEVFGLRLSEEDRKHARVLRLQPGEHIAVIDATSDYFECEIVQATPELTVRITRHEHSAETTAQVMLLQGLCKGEKMDMVIRHATELGVRAFVPLECSRSIVKLDRKKTASRVQRWKAIAKSAAMQSGQPSIPQVSEPMKPEKAANLLSGATCVIVCWEEERSMSLHQAIATSLSKTRTPPEDARVALCIGPEGGFTEEEVEVLRGACEHGYSVTLGPSILRTETAGIVASALTLYELGGLQ